MATKNASNKKKKNPTGKYTGPARARKPVRREVMDSIIAVIAFAVTLFLAFSVYKNMLGPAGLAINVSLQYLFGYTKWLLPFMTLWLGIDLIRPEHQVYTKAKLITGFLLALSISGVFYLFEPKEYFVFSQFFEAVKTMPARSGGLLGGLVAFPLICLIKKLGLIIIILAVGSISALTFFDKTLYQVWFALKVRMPRVEKPKKQAVHAEVVEDMPKRNKKIDIFVDEEPTPVADEDEIPDPEPQPEIIIDGDDVEIKPFSSIPFFVHDDISPDEYITSADLVPASEIKQEKEDIPFEIKTDGLKTRKRTAKAEPEPEPEQQAMYIFPPKSLLNTPKAGGGISREEILTTEKKLMQTLSDFGIEATTVGASVGPIVTRYEIAPSKGVRVSKITSLSDDIALSLAATSIRIEAPIPGKAAVGIEVPNKNKATVYIKELLDSDDFVNAKNPLTVALGKDISGNLVFGDLSDMPHLLVAGATGSGKSVCINTILISLLYKASPDDVKLILIDPKVVELEVYNKIPHLIVPVVTNAKKAAGALQWAVNEMERRYSMFSAFGVRNIKGYNEYIEKNNTEYDKMPQIVIVVDELADLMMTCAKEVEDYIVRICQKARAAGIYLIIATQRPSVNVVTGLIKANVPSRIAFAVTSLVDSRVILDSSGAEKLLGKGDMLFKGRTMGAPLRIQCCFVSDAEVEAVVDHIVEYSGAAVYDESANDAINNYSSDSKSEGGGAPEGDGGDLDDMFWDAVQFVIETGKASASNLQRHFRLGYARAGRIIDDMEKLNIIGPYEGAKPRQVLMTMAEYQEMMVRRED